MGANGIKTRVPKVPADQLALDQALKRLRKLRWIGKDSDAQKTLRILDEMRLQHRLQGLERALGARRA